MSRLLKNRKIAIVLEGGNAYAREITYTSITLNHKTGTYDMEPLKLSRKQWRVLVARMLNATFKKRNG